MTHAPMTERKISSPSVLGDAEKVDTISGACPSWIAAESRITACNANQLSERHEKDSNLSTFIWVWIENML